jgi:Cytochrome P450
MRITFLIYVLLLKKFIDGLQLEISVPFTHSNIWHHAKSRIGVPHATTEDIVFRELYIPKGTILFPNLTSLSSDRDRYIEPELFEPRRHIKDDLDASASALHPDWMQRDHFHYGFGRRLCQGIFVAESSLYITIVRVLWGFNIDRKPGCSLDMNEKIGKASIPL